MDKRINFSSGAPLEEKAGYSRMVKVGNQVFVGGTTSVQPDGSVYGEDNPYEQAKYILERQIEWINKAGALKEDVVKIKAYTTDMKYAKDIGEAYSSLFRDVKPLFTMVGISMLNRPTQLVEIEMDAIIGCSE